MVHGFGVAHAHLLVVPLHHSDDITSIRFTRVEDGKVVVGLGHIPVTTRAELDRLAQIIRAD